MNIYFAYKMLDASVYCIQFIRILMLRFGTNFRNCGNIRSKLCQIKRQVKRSILSIYLVVGMNGKSSKIGLEFKNISGLEKKRV